MFERLPIDLPEIEVITPQSGQSYRVRALVFANEHSFRSSIYSTTKTILDKLNHLIYNAIVSEKPSYEEFISTTTTIDRDSIIYGLYQVSYGDIYNIEKYQCTSCGKKEDLSVSMSSGFNLNKYEGKDPILGAEIPVQLNDRIKAIIVQPTCKIELDEIDNYVNENRDMIWRMHLDRFEYIADDDSEQVISKDKGIKFNIACNQLPSSMVKLITDAIYENFTKYQVECKINYECPHCGHKEELNFDFTQQFFRMVSRSGK